jgi:hypothetical protein
VQWPRLRRPATPWAPPHAPLLQAEEQAGSPVKLELSREGFYNMVSIRDLLDDASALVAGADK